MFCSIITRKLKEMYQMITLGGDAELELVDSLDPFSEGIVFRCASMQCSCAHDCFWTHAAAKCGVSQAMRMRPSGLALPQAWSEPAKAISPK